MTSAPSICQNVIFLAKKVFLNVGPKLFYLGIFGVELENTTVLWFLYMNTLKFFQRKFCPKIKIFKFGTKIVLIEYFELGFQKTNFEFEITILEFFNMQSFIQKQKDSNLGPKIPYIGIFGLQFSKNYHQIFNQDTRICETIKFYPERKKINLGPKTLYFGPWLEC